MKINKEEIAYIAKLAKLSFTEDELLKFTKEFEDIINHFANIDKENLDDIDINSFENFESVLRKDEVKVFKDKKELFRNTKSMRETYVEIPKIIE